MGKHDFDPPWKRKTLVQHGGHTGRVLGYVNRKGAWLVQVTVGGKVQEWPLKETRLAGG